MYTWIFKQIGWKFFVAGAASALVGARYVRPAMVGLTKAGLSAGDTASTIWNQAKSESSKILTEASQLRQASGTTSSSSPSLLDEIRRLREDIAAVKADLHTVKSSA